MIGQCADAGGVAEAPCAVGHFQSDRFQLFESAAGLRQLVDGDRIVRIVENLLALIGVIRIVIRSLTDVDGLRAAVSDRIEDLLAILQACIESA